MCIKLFSVISPILTKWGLWYYQCTQKYTQDTPSCTHGKRLGDAPYPGLPGVSQGILSREYGEVRERSNVIGMWWLANLSWNMTVLFWEALKLKTITPENIKSHKTTSICLNKTLIMLTYGIVSLRLWSWALLDMILMGCIWNQP